MEHYDSNKIAKSKFVIVIKDSFHLLDKTAFYNAQCFNSSHSISTVVLSIYYKFQAVDWLYVRTYSRSEKKKQNKNTSHVHMIGSWFMSFNSLQSINLLYRAHSRFFMRQAKQWNSNQSLSERRRYLFNLIRKINDIRESAFYSFSFAKHINFVRRHVVTCELTEIETKFYSYVIRLMGALTANNYKSQQVATFVIKFWQRNCEKKHSMAFNFERLFNQFP